MNIVILNTINVPIYEQIKAQVKKAIIYQELNEGDLLPSIRQLARDLKISIITTTRAYKDLEAEGIIVNVQGKGCYVKKINRSLIKEEKLKEIKEYFLKAVKSAKLVGVSLKELKEVYEMVLKEESYD